MELKHQVTSLEISQRLKELGVNQESLFWWNLWNGQMDDFMYQICYGKPVKRADGVLPQDTCSAFTVAELGEMLPLGVRANKNGKGSIRGTSYFYYQEEENIGYSTYGYEGREDDLFESLDVTVTTEADARGKMLIYLLENNLITL